MWEPRDLSAQRPLPYIKAKNEKEVVYLVTDPVCGMEIDEKTAKYKTVYNGKAYYFCGPMCKLEFDEKPLKYIESETNDKR
jgi:YHS domain-containing protein